MEEQNKKSLSEISHLFLSSVRDNATGGTRPKRIPPGGERATQRPAVSPIARNSMSIDLTPEEYARVIEQGQTNEQPERAPIGPILAVICSQFNGQQLERAKEYAQHLASGGERVGLLLVDANECTVTCFEATRSEAASNEPAIAGNAREMSQALEELAWDIDRWILLLPNPRTPEARALLKKVNHWVLLSTCDHDGVVNCYRAIKGLAETPRPRLTLALLNAVDQVEAGKVYRKIASVCEQFLNWKMEAEAAVEPSDSIQENLVLTFRPMRDRIESSSAAHWDVVADFLQLAHAESATDTRIEEAESEIAQIETEVEARRSSPPLSPSISPPIPPVPIIEPKLKAAPVAPTIAPIPIEEESDIADLPGGEVTESAVLLAVIAKPHSGLIECPIRPPSCPEAKLAVGRDRRLVLLAATRKGLGELRSIALAYRWVVENRPLLSMAMPQLAIDTHAHPRLKLIVDHADAGADLLLPMSENGNVTVQTYRKLRWAGKTGLLLEAA